MKEAIPFTTAVTMAKSLEELVEDEKKKPSFSQAFHKLYRKARALVTRRRSVPKRTFPLFAKLPLEARLKIWEFATPEPYLLEQIVLLGYQSKEPLIAWNPDLRRWPDAKNYAKARPTPALLHACRESRYEFTYRNFHSALGLGKLKGRPLFAPAFENATGLLSYFSWEQDIVLVNFHEELPRRLSGRLRNVAMYTDIARKYDLGDTMMVDDFPRWIQHLYIMYPSIETFTLFFPVGININAATLRYIANCYSIFLVHCATEKRKNPAFKCPEIRLVSKNIRKHIRVR